MSYGIIRVQKFKAQAVRGIQSHDNRERESKSNPDIDQSKSVKNYDLIESKNYKESIKERLTTLESKRAVRKDAIVIVQCLVTSDSEFFKSIAPEQQKDFFKQSLDFIADRYGKENVISATVHLDEKTPHMHVNFTPIRDKRLTAKTIFSRKELGQLHTDFHKSVGQQWSLQRGESREEKKYHLDTQEFKLKTRREELTKQAMHLSSELRQMQGDDLTPRVTGSKMLGLSSTRETPDQVAQRLNQEFIEPTQDKIVQAKLLQDKIKTLEEQIEKSEPKLKKLEAYNNFFQGLTKTQQEAVRTQVQGFKLSNVKEAEKAQQEALEREKQAEERQGVARKFSKR